MSTPADQDGPRTPAEPTNPTLTLSATGGTAGDDPEARHAESGPASETDHVDAPAASAVPEDRPVSVPADQPAPVPQDRPAPVPQDRPGPVPADQPVGVPGGQPAAATPYAPAPGPLAAGEDHGVPGHRDVRMRTVVLGLVLLVIAGSVLLGQLAEVTVDAGGVLLALMIGGGLLLIAGARRT